MRDFCPLSRFPKGESRGGRETPTPPKAAAPPTRGFSKRLAENPLIIPREQTALTESAVGLRMGRGLGGNVLSSTLGIDAFYHAVIKA
jgi:hypothetical protein